MEFDCLQNSGRFFSALSRDLKSLALSNVQFFEDGKQSYHAKFHMSFCLLYDYLDLGIEPSFRELSNHVHLFDVSPNIKANGYRSILHVVQKCCLHLLQLVRYISSVRDSILFRKKFYAQELEAYVSALGQLRAVLYYSLKLLNYCQEGDLFTDNEVIHDQVAQSLMLEIEELNQECFYGRCIGFQFCSSMLRPLQALGIAMASYSEGYLESSSVMQVATSVFNSGKYFLDPELRAEQIVKATRTSDIRFCKALWGLSETGLMLQLPAFVCPAVELDELFPLGPDAFELPLDDGSDTVVITPPCAHTGPGHVYVRLISAQLRDGQESFKKTGRTKSPPVTKPRTTGLVIHIHGGGFVAHSSQSHEVYLRDWAHIVNVPIVSIDYSLSPEMPFPRALEECFYAYAWVVKNCEQLGSTGESIVLVGDSAGGNLAIATAMRAASFGIRRPEGIVPVYACTMVSYTPSPARLLSLMDPLLSFGLLSRCLAAYAGINEEHPLATPQEEEFQSEASLSSLQMQTMETTTDQDWIIIAQNKQECMAIDERLAAKSPITESRGMSVVDSLEDSFHGGDEEERETRPETDQTDTGVGTEEVEIFTQLAAAGNCVFPKEGRRPKPGVVAGKDNNSNVHQFADSVKDEERSDGGGGGGNDGARSPSNEKNVSKLVGFHETAKSVVAGAQSMFSSLTSLIPKRARQNSCDQSQSVAAHDDPSTAMTLPPDIDCFVDLSYSSDPVDCSIRSNNNSDLLGNSASESSRLSRVHPVVCSLSDSFHSVSELRSELQADSPSAGGQIEQHQDFHEKTVDVNGGVMKSDDDPKANAIDPLLPSTSFLIQDSAEAPYQTGHGHCLGEDRIAVTREKIIAQSETGSEKSTLIEAVRVRGSETTESCLFQSALSSPVADGTSCPAAMTSSCLESPSALDNELMSTDLTNSKPTLGMSPNTENAADTHAVSNGRDTDLNRVASSPPLDFSEMPAASLSTLLDSDANFIASDCLEKSPQPASTRLMHTVAHTGTTDTSEHVSTRSSNTRALSPNSPPSFTPDDYSSCDPRTLTCMPSLPQERKELLDDAIGAADEIQTVDAVGVASTVQAANGLSDNKVNNIKHSSESIQNAFPQIQGVISESGMESQDSFQKYTPSTPDKPGMADKPSVHHVPIQSNHNIVIAEKDVETGCKHLFPSVENNDGVSESHSGQTATSPPSGRSAVKPPTQLRLAKTTSDVLPGTTTQRVNLDSGLSSEAMDADLDELDFDKSCLEFLTPSSTVDVNFSADHMVDGIFRSESAPALSSLMTPSPAVGSRNITTSSRVGLNGLRMGMSPSDFKRRTFTTHSPMKTMMKSSVVRNPYMSPLLAPEDLIRGLPPVTLVACHLDPLLDDTIMFAKRLKSYNMPFDLHLIDDLPHGFLNFSLISTEAKQASRFCAQKVLDFLEKAV